MREFTLALAVTLCLVGCDKAPTVIASSQAGKNQPDAQSIALSKQDAEAILLRQLGANCDVHTVSVYSYPHPNAALLGFQAWLNQAIFTVDSGFTMTSDQSFPGTNMKGPTEDRNYTFQQNGITWNVPVEMTGFIHDDGTTEPLLASIQGCAFLASSVSILDTNVDSTGKIENVTFSVTQAPTPLELKVASGNLAALGVSGDWPQTVPAPSEHTAVLRRLDATGWRIESLN